MAENEEKETEGLDLKDVDALASDKMKRDPWYSRLGDALARFFVKFFLLIVQVVWTVIKGIWTLIGGFFLYLWKGIKLIGKTAVKIKDDWLDVDNWGKASFFVMGLGQIKAGQIVDGVIYLFLEIIFIVWMILFGGYNLLLLSLDESLVDKNVGAQNNLIAGILTIVVCIGFLIVYYFSVKGMHDDYMIKNYIRFKAARTDALDFFEEHANDEEIRKYSHHRIYSLAREEGYSKLSSRYIAKIPFRKLNPKREVAFFSFFKKIGDKIYTKYDFVRNKIRQTTWSTVFSAFLNWKRVKPNDGRGYDNVKSYIVTRNLSFNHTYVKFNDYYSVERDTKTLIDVLSQPSKIIDAVYAKDEVSKVNGVEEIQETYSVTDKKGHTKQVKYKFNVKNISPRIVGAFDISYPLAKQITKFYIKARKLSNMSKGKDFNLPLNLTSGKVNSKALPGHSVEEILGAYCKAYKRYLEDFEKENHTERLANSRGYVSAFTSFSKLEPAYKAGGAFANTLHDSFHLNERQIKEVRAEWNDAYKKANGDKEEARRILELKSSRYKNYVEFNEHGEFHGQPIRFKKKAKEYTDERFVVTILALPVLGSIMVTIIPLIFSILIAFTNWDRDHANRVFTWNLDGWNNLFGMAGEGEFTRTFLELLVWTLVWAVFATFTNYIFGIILALMINRKSIRLKKVWRTVFVITIAVPQFITLLCMSKLLSATGPINTWLLTQDWYTNGLSKALNFGTYTAEGVWHAEPFPFLTDAGSAQNLGMVSATNWFANAFTRSFWPKLTCIVVNMWVGIPYTMLQTSGILMNIPGDLYESSQIDGASKWKQFWCITMPYVFFVTGPWLLTQFIGNINNFNVIFFLTSGGLTGNGLSSKAGSTSLLITWIFNLSTGDQDNYSIASIIGVIIFFICGFSSIMAYGNLGSVKNEEEFQ